MILKRIPRRFWLIFFGAIITIASFFFTDKIAKELAIEEQRKMETWAEATKLLLNDEYSDFVFRIIEQNENIPVIIVDEQFNYISARNFNPPATNEEEYYKRQIKRLRDKNEPIEIKLDDFEYQYIYYDDSLILKYLAYFPFVQLALISLFLIMLIWVISTDKRAEQNKVWVGLTKETAHQLGTPISSLIAWIEILKTKYTDEIAFGEMDKDVERLQTITERFSKIGSRPELTPGDVNTITEQAINYMRSRSSKKVIYSIENKANNTIAPLSTPLFEWVIENLSKNSIDAMNGNGNIDFEIFNEDKSVIIEITDSGKGIERSKFKTVFQPGFTSKKRGWGLGLSLSKRIIEEYHNGKIFVKSSDINLGTTFRIELPIYNSGIKA